MRGKSELTSITVDANSSTEAVRMAQDTALNGTIELRRRLREQRSAMGSPARQEASADICHWLTRPGPAQWRQYLNLPGDPPEVIAAFWPLAEEPDLRPVLLAWQSHGYRIVLPEVAQPGVPLLFRRWHPEAPMRADHYGIPVPTGGPCEPDMLLVPTLGFTDTGDRIGYGGGYYDRTLAALAATNPSLVAIGVAFYGGKVSTDEHQPAAHDITLHAIVTEKGWVRPAPT